MSDFIAEQDYRDAVRRAHDTRLHTFGIAAGLEAKLAPDGQTVTVSEGAAVGPGGDIMSISTQAIPVPTKTDMVLILTPVKEPAPPLSAENVPRLRVGAALEWCEQGDMDPATDLIITKLLAGSKLDGSLRRYVGMNAGALRFACAQPSTGHAPSIDGWSMNERYGLRVDADEVCFSRPDSGSDDVDVSIATMLAIHTMNPRATLDVRSPIELEKPMIARFASPTNQDATLVCGADGRVGLGTATPSARLTVGKGDIQIDGPSREIRLGDSGRIMLDSGADGIQLDGAKKRIGLSSRGDISLRAGASPIELVLSADGKVVLGKPDLTATIVASVKLVVRGVIQSVDPDGGFMFPDGTVQTAALLPVPIGTIIDWWCPNPKTPIPDGYKICDGTSVSDGNDPWNGELVPDLKDVFVRGAQDIDTIGKKGGGSAHTHTLKIPGHQHRFPHTHPVPDTLATSPADDSLTVASDAATLKASCDEAHTHKLTVTFSPPLKTSSDTGETLTGKNSDAGDNASTGDGFINPPFISLLKLIRYK